MSENGDAIAANVAQVRRRIAEAASRGGRDPNEITLVAVTKTVDPDRMRAAAATGILDFGENYYQEVRDKIPLFPAETRWHFIGHLQSNKAKYIAGRFALIHSVDSVALGQEIGSRAARMAQIQDVLIEVKIDESATKQGVEPSTALELAANLNEIPGLRLRGLMGMAPFGESPEDARPHFRRLKGIFDQLLPANREILSMGMTGDFEVAIEEGSTLVRVGTAIFGRRG